MTHSCAQGHSSPGDWPVPFLRGAGSLLTFEVSPNVSPKRDCWEVLAALCILIILDSCPIVPYLCLCLSPLLEKDHLFNSCARPSAGMAIALGLLEHSGF